MMPSGSPMASATPSAPVAREPIHRSDATTDGERSQPDFMQRLAALAPLSVPRSTAKNGGRLIVRFRPPMQSELADLRVAK